MKRRTFLYKILTGCSAVAVVAFALAKSAIPRRFLRAKPVSKYPGRIKRIENIASQSQWSG